MFWKIENFEIARAHVVVVCPSANNQNTDVMRRDYLVVQHSSDLMQAPSHFPAPTLPGASPPTLPASELRKNPTGNALLQVRSFAHSVHAT